MKVVILAGGLGTRISEESIIKPKPMIEIGEHPILWHIMKYYSAFGYNDFIICLGYKSYSIKNFFANYFLHSSDVTFDIATNEMQIHNNYAEPWKVTLVDTGLNTMTGGRLKRIKSYLGDDNTFMLTYGDGVSDVNINELVEFHKQHGKIATISAIKPAARFGILEISYKMEVTAFREKSKEDAGWINGGFMVLDSKMLDYIDGDSTVLEQEPFKRLLEDNQLMAYKHNGFWQCMDTQRDKLLLEKLWYGSNPPWVNWTR